MKQIISGLMKPIRRFTMRFERTTIATIGLLLVLLPAGGTLDGSERAWCRPTIGSRSFKGHECAVKQDRRTEQTHRGRSRR